MFDRHRKKSHQENIALNWGKDLGLRASVLLVREKTHFTINVRGKKNHFMSPLKKMTHHESVKWEKRQWFQLMSKGPVDSGHKAGGLRHNSSAPRRGADTTASDNSIRSLIARPPRPPRADGAAIYPNAPWLLVYTWASGILLTRGDAQRLPIYQPSQLKIRINKLAVKAPRLNCKEVWGVKCFCRIYIYQAKEFPRWAAAELGAGRRRELKAVAG